MEISLDSDLQDRLDRLAAQQGRSSQTLVVEAIENLLGFDEWFVREVEKGMIAADTDRLHDHEQVRKMIARRPSR